jgi:hypothetical protein
MATVILMARLRTRTRNRPTWDGSLDRPGRGSAAGLRSISPATNPDAAAAATAFQGWLLAHPRASTQRSASLLASLSVARIAASASSDCSLRN